MTFDELLIDNVRLRTLIKDAETQHIADDDGRTNYCCPWCHTKTTWHKQTDPECTKNPDGSTSIPLRPQTHVDCEAFTQDGTVR